MCQNIIQVTTLCRCKNNLIHIAKCFYDSLYITLPISLEACGTLLDVCCTRLGACVSTLDACGTTLCACGTTLDACAVITGFSPTAPSTVGSLSS